MDYAPLRRRALRAIRYANVRFGILPSRSGFCAARSPGMTETDRLLRLVRRRLEQID